MPESNSRKPTDINRIIRTYQEKQQKKQRNHVLLFPVKIIASVLAIALGVYFIISTFYAFNTPMTTTLALNTSVNDEFSIAGYFVRRETLVEADYEGILQYTIPDGQKVSRNAPFAAVYSDASALETNAVIASLDERIASLESALKASNDTTSTEKLAASISEQLLNVTEIADKGTYTLFSQPANDLKTLVVNREFAFTESSDIQADIDALKQQRTELKQSLGEREKVLYTPRAGYFVSHVDGYEELLTVSAVTDMTVSEFDALADYEYEATSSALGKIVTDFEWYFACTLRRDEVAQLTEGKKVTMQFDATGDLLIEAQVDHIGSKVEDETVVVFRGSDSLDKLILLRKQAATIIL